MQLIVEKYGTKISFSSGMLILTTDDKCEEIPLLHITSVRLHTQVRISSDAVIQCIKSGIPVFFESGLTIDAIIWSPQFGSIANIRQKQYLLAYSRLKYPVIISLLKRKNTERTRWLNRITGKQQLTLLTDFLCNINKRFESCIASKNDALIRSLEAQASKKYFEFYKTLFPAGLQFETREHRNATHLVNRLLNYGYGILYNEITKSLIVAGLDPYGGLFHANQYNKPALTYDIIEPYRAWVEFIVWKFCKKNSPGLHPGTPLEGKQKHRFITMFFEFMSNTVIQWDKLRKSPLNIIQINAHKLASYINKTTEKELINTLTDNQ